MTRASDNGRVPERSRTTRRLAADEEYVLGSELELNLPPGHEPELEPILDPDAPVMVIDDSPSMRKIVRYKLQRVGISVVAFPNGLSALHALYTRQVAPPRVLLLDIVLPDINGYDLARDLRKNPGFAQTQIIMLSGMGGIVNHLKAHMVGARGYIEKPFASDDLVKRVCEALGLLNVTEW